jgi:hypothetical protein
VGRCWAKNVNGLRTQKKKEGGLLGRKRSLGWARGQEAGGCGDGLEQRLGQKEGKGKVCSFLFFKFLFPPKTNKQI